MPNTPSAKKRLRQSQEQRVRNRAVKSQLRALDRKVREAVAAGDSDTAAVALRDVSKRLDKAGSKGVIHKNAVARRKSRLTAAVKKLKKA
jgi:small subunit ribosomal protein S20